MNDTKTVETLGEGSHTFLVVLRMVMPHRIMTLLLSLFGDGYEELCLSVELPKDGFITVDFDCQLDWTAKSLETSGCTCKGISREE